MTTLSKLLQPTGHIREGRQQGAIGGDQGDTKLLGGRHEFAVISAAATGGHELKHGPGAHRLLMVNHQELRLLLQG